MQTAQFKAVQVTMDTNTYHFSGSMAGTGARRQDSMGTEGSSLLREHGSCREAGREQLARLQSWSDSSPPPSLPLSFQGASRHLYCTDRAVVL